MHFSTKLVEKNIDGENGYWRKVAGSPIASSPLNCSWNIAYSADTLCKMFRALSKTVPTLRNAMTMRFMATQVSVSAFCLMDRPSSPWRRWLLVCSMWSRTSTPLTLTRLDLSFYPVANSIGHCYCSFPERSAPRLSERGGADYGHWGRVRPRDCRRCGWEDSHCGWCHQVRFWASLRQVKITQKQDDLVYLFRFVCCNTLENDQLVLERCVLFRENRMRISSWRSKSVGNVEFHRGFVTVFRRFLHNNAGKPAGVYPSASLAVFVLQCMQKTVRFCSSAPFARGIARWNSVRLYLIYFFHAVRNNAFLCILLDGVVFHGSLCICHFDAYLLPLHRSGSLSILALANSWQHAADCRIRVAASFLGSSLRMFFRRNPNLHSPEV